MRGSVSSCGLIIYVPLFSYIQMIKWQLLKFRWKKNLNACYEHASCPATATIIMSLEWVIFYFFIINWRNEASFKLSARNFFSIFYFLFWIFNTIEKEEEKFLELMQKFIAMIFDSLEIVLHRSILFILRILSSLHIRHLNQYFIYMCIAFSPERSIFWRSLRLSLMIR